MSWPLDQYPIQDAEEDPQPLPENASAPSVVASPIDQRRTAADAVLEALEGRTRPVVHDVTKCPLCGAPTKRRPTAIGVTTITRRCTNGKCRNEFAIASTRVLVDVPPPPPNPLVLGGPYKGGPDRGGGRPPIDPNEPMNRRLAEVIRRINDDD